MEGFWYVVVKHPGKARPNWLRNSRLEFHQSTYQKPSVIISLADTKIGSSLHALFLVSDPLSHFKQHALKGLSRVDIIHSFEDE